MNGNTAWRSTRSQARLAVNGFTLTSTTNSPNTAAHPATSPRSSQAGPRAAHPPDIAPAGATSSVTAMTPSQLGRRRSQLFRRRARPAQLAGPGSAACPAAVGGARSAARTARLGRRRREGEAGGGGPWRPGGGPDAGRAPGATRHRCRGDQVLGRCRPVLTVVLHTHYYYTECGTPSGADQVRGRCRPLLTLLPYLHHHSSYTATTRNAALLLHGGSRAPSTSGQHAAMY